MLMTCILLLMNDIFKTWLQIKVTRLTKDEKKENLRMALRKKSIESGVQEILMESMEAFFELKDFNMKVRTKNGNYIDYLKTVVLCKNITAFVNYVLATKNWTRQEVSLKFGIDAGGNFFKICLKILREIDPLPNFMDSCQQFKFKSNVPKEETEEKLFILAIVQGNYY